MDITAATDQHIEAVCLIDEIVLGNASRREYLFQAILDGKCYIAKMDHEPAGFIIYDTTFYHHAFIWLVIVSPRYRRKGIATALIQHIESISPTEKLFTSTNESNTDMHHLCESLGFAKSGWIENLDEGDPEIVYYKSREIRLNHVET
ncbi:GNAT family N-acetyltransferase [Paenibacillus aestuarii]|uniref:GNAT family N-acetyltransferase n=1 Tax=Paenibacillus aestuarii TaxID=516965 RepID=A0ABW0K2S8_9BACL|nr:GNAT family N-acetyltransferase [Paenibacillus aestuarii]